jgi:hypothetical protein
MHRYLDLKQVSQIVFTLVISVVVISAFYGIMSIGRRNSETRGEKIKQVIDKALMQCYALEGSYPSDLRYLSKYGVLFDDSKYEYYYELTWVTYMPLVVVIPLD